MTIKPANRRLLGVIFCLTLPLALCRPVQAETVKRISMGTAYDSNAYGSYEKLTDYVSRLGLYLGYRVPSDRSEVEYYYTGDGNLFVNTGARTFATSSLGVVYARKIGENRSGFSVGASSSLRTNRADYNFYNYAGIQGAANGKWYIHPTVLLRTGYRLRWRNYWNLDTFSYTEHYLSAQIDKYLPTQTTLRGDISFGYKNHRNPQYETVGLGGRFQRGMGPSQSILVEQGVPDEGQVILGVQVAQSLARKTGLSLRYQTRVNTTSGSDVLPEGESAYIDDDEIFNDRYDYEGHEWTARLTQLLPWRSRAVFEGGYETRRYGGRTAQDLSGQSVASGVFRRDRATFVSISLEKPFAPGVSVGLWYGYERNRSNDLYYDYSGRHGLSVGLNVEF